MHEAASYGVPVRATELLRAQRGWQREQQMMAAAPTDPEAFAAHIAALYKSEPLWTKVCNAAAAHIREACGQPAYERAIAQILA